MTLSAANAKRMLLAIEVPRDELVLRIAETAIGIKRPPGISPTDALAQLRQSESETVDSFYRIAEVAVLYFHECVNAGRQPS